MKADAVKALVDFEASGIPEDYSLDDFDLEYSVFGIDTVLDLVGDNVVMKGIVAAAKASGLTNLWAEADTGMLDTGFASNVTMFIQEKIEDLTGLGISHIQAGDDQTVRIRYQDGDWANGTLTVNKANVKVTVRSAALYFDQVRGENFVTTDPEDDFTIFTFYAGINTDLEPTVYFQPPENALLTAAMKVIDPIYKALNGVTLTDALENGKTVGEVRVIADNAINAVQDASQTELGRAVLSAAGIDVDMINGLVDAMQQISGIADNWRFAIGQPNRAGAYATVAVAVNRNYNPGIGVGVLLVKMRLFGVSLQWNDANAKTFTVGDTVDLGAYASYDGAVVDQNLMYAYVGLTEAGGTFFGKDAPTEAGHYLQAAFTIGGNYLALPIVRLVTVNAGE